jgi:hypothetical protein
MDNLITRRELLKLGGAAGVTLVERAGEQP